MQTIPEYDTLALDRASSPLPPPLPAAPTRRLVVHHPVRPRPIPLISLTTVMPVPYMVVPSQPRPDEAEITQTPPTWARRPTLHVAEAPQRNAETAADTYQGPPPSPASSLSSNSSITSASQPTDSVSVSRLSSYGDDVPGDGSSEGEQWGAGSSIHGPEHEGHRDVNDTRFDDDASPFGDPFYAEANSLLVTTREVPNAATRVVYYQAFRVPSRPIKLGDRLALNDTHDRYIGVSRRVAAVSISDARWAEFVLERHAEHEPAIVCAVPVGFGWAVLPLHLAVYHFVAKWTLPNTYPEPPARPVRPDALPSAWALIGACLTGHPAGRC